MDKIIRVSDIINGADPAEVIRIYNEQHNDIENGNDDGWGKIAVFHAFRDRMNSSVGVRTSFVMVLRHLVRDWSKITNGKITEIEERFDISAHTSENDDIYTIVGMDWGKCKEMPFLDRTGKDLSIHEQAAHIYNEMTEWGWPEQAEQRYDMLLDMAEEITRTHSEDGDPENAEN